MKRVIKRLLSKGDPAKCSGEREHSEGYSRRCFSGMLLGGSLMSVAGAKAAVRSKDSSDDQCAHSDLLGIERLIFQYAMAVDSLDSASFADCFVPDAVLVADQVTFTGSVSISTDFIGNLRKFYRENGFEYVRHNLTNRLYDVRGLEASGVAYIITDIVINAAGARTIQTLRGEYRDELVKVDGRWRLRKRIYSSLFIPEKTPVVFFNETRARGAWYAPPSTQHQ